MKNLGSFGGVLRTVQRRKDTSFSSFTPPVGETDGIYEQGIRRVFGTRLLPVLNLIASSSIDDGVLKISIGNRRESKTRRILLKMREGLKSVWPK